jgi:succinate dehydrogenase / fumarate reductase, cytochrome b subunit
MQPLRVWLGSIWQYRTREGMIAFLLHRLSGLATLLFLTIHILDTSTVYFLPQLYNDAIGMYRSPAFMLGEIGLVAGVIYHGVNGCRIAIFDLFFPSAWRKDRERTSVWTTLAITIVLWLPAAAIMSWNLIGYAFLGWK